MKKNIFSNAEMISPQSDKYYFEENEKYYHFEEEELTQCPFVSNEFTIETLILCCVKTNVGTPTHDSHTTNIQRPVDTTT